jgi:acetyl-CoA carboxylase biotin carboxylase subunit
MFDTLLIANRGEIARRVMRTARRMGLRTVAVYSDVDAELPFAREADEAVPLGGPAPADSYMNHYRTLQAARQTGAQAIHPGYGFLSENASFAAAVERAGLVWVGPGPEVIAMAGNKIRARNAFSDAGFPVSAGSRTPVTEVSEAVSAAERIGYPVMLKPAAGGGGMGMAAAAGSDEVAAQLERISAFAARSFGDPAVLVERFLPVVRHVEVQILGLTDGRVVALGTRDCSVQRRNQKLAEETPSPGVTPELRERMCRAAVLAGQTVGYRNAGTVECLVDPAAQDFVFLEMNTRLQVEHAITEAVTGIDIVEQQLRIAAGMPVTFDRDAVHPEGHAIELRINAEDPVRFRPGPGVISRWHEPRGAGVRVDAGYAEGTAVGPHYDSLMAKLIVYGVDRDQAMARARRAVGDYEITGPKHNLPFFAELLNRPEFVSGDYDTGIVARMR